MFGRVAAAALIACALGAVPGAAARQQSSAGAAATRAPATASMSGIVTGDGAPLARVRVVVRSPALAQARVALTDARGAYKFDRLPAGDYQLTATRTGFVVPYALGGPVRGVAVRLQDGQARDNGPLALERAATIPGRLLDEDGTPLAGAHIEALSLRAPDGPPLLAIASGATDDRGEFRLTGLPGGQYYIAARDPSFTNVGDASGAVRYAPTYHPGVLSPAEAQAVNAVAGQDSPRVEFRLRVTRPAAVNGNIVAPNGRTLLNGSIVLLERDSPLTVPLLEDDVEIRPDGGFGLRNVPPGRYQLRVRAEVDSEGPMWFASYALSIDGYDVDGLRLTLTPGSMLGGRVESASRADERRRATAAARVRAPMADGSSFGDALSGAPGGDGTFQIRGVMPGPHYLRLEGLAGPWEMTGVFLGGRNVIDHPFDVTGGRSIADVRITVAANAPELRGIVRDARGNIVRDALVITAPPPPMLASPSSPRVRATRTDGEGKYRFGSLPPGDYRIAAVPGIDELSALRREWLERVARNGAGVTLAASGAHTLDLGPLTTAPTPTAR